MLTSLLCLLLSVLVYKSQQNKLPFYLLYERDPWLPTTLGLDSGWQQRRRQQQQQQQHLNDLDTYKAEVAFKFSEAWKLARYNIKKAQQCQKKHYDRKTRLPRFKVGDQVLFICLLPKYVRLINLHYHFMGHIA